MRVAVFLESEIVTLADELRSLDQLQQSGTLTAEEFKKAKEVLLHPSTQPTAVVAPANIEQRLDTIEIQNEVARLDREWALAVPTYEFTGRYGQRFLPNVLSGMIYIFVGGFCGLFWAVATFIFAQLLSEFPPLDWFFYGIAALAALFALSSIVRGLAHLVVSQNYATAFHRYQTHRSDAIARLPQTAS